MKFWIHWPVLRRGDSQTTWLGFLHRAPSFGGPQPRGGPPRLVHSSAAAASERVAATFVVALFNRFSLEARSATIAKDITSLADVNREELHVVEMPASNGKGTAGSIAKLYASAATGGTELGLSPSILDALKKPAQPPTNGVRDKVLHVDTSFSLGFSTPPPKCLRLLGRRVWNARTRRLVRIRRSRHRHRIRVCDEQVRFFTW